jgi:hypothetical protein
MTTATVIPIDWVRLTNWLTDMEECLPEGMYLYVCDVMKQLYSAQTLEEQRFFIDELKRSGDWQWMFAARNLLCC